MPTQERVTNALPLVIKVILLNIVIFQQENALVYALMTHIPFQIQIHYSVFIIVLKVSTKMIYQSPQIKDVLIIVYLQIGETTQQVMENVWLDVLKILLFLEML